MSETVRKRIPVFKRSPYLCVWLQEMAEQGLALKSIGLFSCEFEKSEPQKRRYRILNKSYFSMNDEEKGIYEDAGWKYVPYEASGITVFTAEDEDTPELFSDRESYHKSVKSKWIGAAVMIFVWIYWMIDIASDFAGIFGYDDYAATYGRLHNFDGEPLYIYVIIAVLTVILTAIFIYYIWNEIQIIRIYTKNNIPDHQINYDDKGYLREKKANHLWSIASVVLIVGLASVWIGMQVSDYSLTDGLSALEWTGEHPVMLRELDPETWAEVKPMIVATYTEDYDDTLSIDYMAGKDTGACFTKGWREQMSIDLITGEDTAEEEFPATGVDLEDIDKYVPPLLTSTRYYYFSAYYIARSESIAEEYLGEEAAYDLYGKVDKGAWSKALDEVYIECDGVDFAGYYTTHDPDAERYYECQHLLLRKGKIIQIISYQGSIDLRNRMDLFVNEMSE